MFVCLMFICIRISIKHEVKPHIKAFRAKASLQWPSLHGLQFTKKRKRFFSSNYGGVSANDFISQSKEEEIFPDKSTADSLPHLITLNTDSGINMETMVYTKLKILCFFFMKSVCISIKKPWCSFSLFSISLHLFFCLSPSLRPRCLCPGNRLFMSIPTGNPLINVTVCSEIKHLVRVLGTGSRRTAN